MARNPSKNLNGMPHLLPFENFNADGHLCCYRCSRQQAQPIYKPESEFMPCHANLARRAKLEGIIKRKVYCRVCFNLINQRNALYERNRREQIDPPYLLFDQYQAFIFGPRNTLPRPNPSETLPC